MSTAILSVERLKSQLGTLRKKTVVEKQNPQARRFIFNPFNPPPRPPETERYEQLDSILARISGFDRIPAGQLFPVDNHSYIDTNYQAIGLSELIAASESVNQPRDKTFTRSALIIADSVVRELGGEGASPKGLAILEALTGLEDDAIVIDMQQTFFPVQFGTVDEQMAHLGSAEMRRDLATVAPIWEMTRSRLYLASAQNKRWCEKALEATKASMEERAGTRGIGKREPSDLDHDICAWLGLEVPRALTKLDLGEKPKEKEPYQITVQTQAPEGDGLERRQCRVCGEKVALIDGDFPPICRFGDHDPRGVKAKPAAVAPKPPASPAPAKPPAQTPKLEGTA